MTEPEKMKLESLDLAEEKREQLKALFPEVFAEDKIDFDQLKRTLGEWVEPGKERYSLNWPGKAECMKIIQQSSIATLKPARDESVNFDETENVFIEGDNLEVLKLLQKAYFGKVKMIYIDPPYNTGNEFIYPDKFQETLETYLAYTQQSDNDGKRFSTNTDTSGRYHSNWLNMMYPRLYLARNLLKDDGVIVIHIDENEYPNLEKMLSEIFGEENNLGTIVWDKRNPKGDATGVAQQHELVSLYCKNREYFKDNGNFKRPKENAEAMLNKVEQLISTNGGVNDTVRAKYKEWLKKQDFSGGDKAYCFIDDDGDIYRPVSMAWPNKKKAPDNYFIPLKHPVTKKECPIPERGWRNPPETMEQLQKDGLILFGVDETTQPNRKYLLKENLYENVSSLIYYGGSDDALLSELGVWFDTPKVVDVSKKLILPICKEEDILLDFFAGSATSAHALVKLNQEDKEKRKFIMVQLPELCDEKSEAFKSGYKTIAEISKERIRRAAAKIKEENPDYEGDLGFKVFKLDKSNFKVWEGDVERLENLEQQLFDHVDHISDASTPEDILYELLLKSGFPLTTWVETIQLGGKDVFSVEDGALLICLDKALTQGVIDDIANANPLQVICLDEGFRGNDQLKANAVQTFKARAHDDKDHEIVFRTV